MSHPLPDSLYPLDLYPALDRFDSHSYHEVDKARAIYDWFARKLLPLSLELDYYSPADLLHDGKAHPKTANLYVRTNATPDPTKPSLMFVTHLDTAATKAAIRPYAQGTEFAYGSGIASSQTAIVGMMITCVEQYACYARYPGQIIFAFIADGKRTGSGSMQHVERLHEDGVDDNSVIILTHPSDNFQTIEVGKMGNAELELTAPLPDLVAALQALMSERLRWQDDDSINEHFTTLSSVMPTRIWCDENVHSTHQHTKYYGDVYDVRNAPIIIDEREHSTAIEEMLRELTYHGQAQTLVNLQTPLNDEPYMTVPQCDAYFGSTPRTPTTAHATLWLHITPKFDKQKSLLRRVQALCNEYGVAVEVKQHKRAYQTTPYAEQLCQQSLLKPAQPVINGGGAVWSYPTVTSHLVGAFGAGTRQYIGSPDEKIYLDDALHTPNVYARIIRTFLAMHGSARTPL